MSMFEELTVGKRTITGGGAPAGSTLGAPTTGTLSAVHECTGVINRSTFTMTNANVPVTDAAGSGSYGTLKLFTFPPGSISFIGCRQNYTATTEGALLTGAAGDAVYKWGVGTEAIASAADGLLATVSVDIGSATGAITNSGGTGAATVTNHTATAFDGTATNATLNLNWSGTAATIDATSTIGVTGTITVLWAMLGDD